MAGGTLLAVAFSLVDRWRAMGPVLWLIAAAAALAWALLLAASLFATRSPDVAPGPATLDLAGPEPPAVVNLLANGWRLGHEAVPATLLDLAARRIVAVDQVGERTLVRVPPGGRRRDELEPYEEMALDHVTQHAVDGVVPAEALTTGPEEEAKGWWRSFRKSVERDARTRGLSRRRWSPGVHTMLTVAALVVAALVAVAATTLPDDPDDSDDDPVGAALGFGGIAAVALMAAVEALNGQRDTPAGREAAARWLGLRTVLADDPIFADYPPAGVAIWDRLLSYGASMGVARGAVRALPLGAERDDEAWSSVGGQWRVVRIRYPHFIPPGYGRHPGVVVLLGLFQLGLAALAFPVARAAGSALLEFASDFSSDKSTPGGLKVFVGVMLAVIVTMAAVFAVRGAAMLLTGGADLLGPRRRVEGRVLRVRRRGDDEHPRWYVAVDEGNQPRIRAWQAAPGPAVQGSTVRADVSRRLAHVKNLAVVEPPPSRPLPADEPEEESPLGRLLGRTSSGEEHAQPLPAATGPPPPLPDAATVSALIGRSVEVDPNARPHPLAGDGRSVALAGADGTVLQMAWVDPSFLRGYRGMPRLLRRPLTGVGDEAYRAVIGGGLVARRDGHVLLVMGRLPGEDDEERDRVFQKVARAALGG